MSDKPFDLKDDPQFDSQYASPILNSLERARKKRMLLFKLSLFFALTAFLSGFLFYLYVRFAPLPNSELVNHSQVLATDGTVMTDFSNNGQTSVRINIQDIPENLQHATVSIEDAQFYQHSGINLRGIARALYVDLKQGEIVEGGSSITQQLAKVLFLSQERTFSRKVRELLLTMQLEARYSKQEILEDYLNSVYYGYGANGVGNAANLYFGKPVSELNLAESSMLAGIPKGPTYYSPFNDMEKAKERQQQVLQAMVRNGFITQDQADKAYRQPLHFAEKKEMQTGIAPYFTQYVKWSAMNLNGIPEDELFNSGLTLQTTLDLNMQKAAEAAVQKYLPANSGLQVALLAMDPKTGEIKAMVGGKDFAQSSYNRVLAKRQPGSSFKPILYLTALDNGLTSATLFKSEPTTFTYDNNKTYAVKNFANEYTYDNIDMREAIQRSDNVYAVHTILKVTPEKVIETAHRLGIQDGLKPYPSLALGVFPVSPLELARAYAVLANGGTLVEPTTIKQVVNAYGREIYHRDPATQQAADPRTAYILTDMMKSIFEPGGTAARIASSVSNRVVAGKTGTTDTDAWMAGFTPNLVTVVWVGYDKDRLLNTVESHAPAQIWGEFMKTALQSVPATDFARPQGLIEANIDPTTGLLATDNCPRVQRAFFKIGTEPTKECNVHASAGGSKPKAQLEQDGYKQKIWKWIRGSH